MAIVFYILPSWARLSRLALFFLLRMHLPIIIIFVILPLRRRFATLYVFYILLLFCLSRLVFLSLYCLFVVFFVHCGFVILNITVFLYFIAYIILLIYCIFLGHKVSPLPNKHLSISRNLTLLNIWHQNTYNISFIIFLSFPFRSSFTQTVFMPVTRVQEHFLHKI